MWRQRRNTLHTDATRSLINLKMPDHRKAGNGNTIVFNQNDWFCVEAHSGVMAGVVMIQKSR